MTERRADVGACMPHGQIGIVALESCEKLGCSVDRHLMALRGLLPANGDGDSPDGSYLIQAETPRFQTGDSKAVLLESVRGRDVFVMGDVGNYSCTYRMFGKKVRMGPDEHFQDIKRVISAIAGNAGRVSVIMPLLYAGRQHKRKARESLDCAVALQELERMGVENIITFDAHDPRVENAVPLIGLENLYPTTGIIQELLTSEETLRINKDDMIIISPDTGAMDRAIYYASVLDLDIGLFYKRRDLTRVVNGTNPIIEHEYMGSSVRGKSALIVDDIISSGESILEIVEELRERGVKDVYIAATYAFFTGGTDDFDAQCRNGCIKRLFSTNLTYVPKKLRKRPWYRPVDMSGFLAQLINRLNHDTSISSLLDPDAEVQALIDARRS